MTESEKKKCANMLKELGELFTKHNMSYVFVTPFSCGAYGLTTEIVSLFVIHGFLSENTKLMFDEVTRVYQEVTLNEDFMATQKKLIQKELEEEKKRNKNLERG